MEGNKMKKFIGNFKWLKKEMNRSNNKPLFFLLVAILTSLILWLIAFLNMGYGIYMDTAMEVLPL